MFGNGERTGGVVVCIPVDGVEYIWSPVVAMGEVVFDNRLAGGVEERVSDFVKNSSSKVRGMLPSLNKAANASWTTTFVLILAHTMPTTAITTAIDSCCQ
jgi:hypothetical protein